METQREGDGQIETETQRQMLEWVGEGEGNMEVRGWRECEGLLKGSESRRGAAGWD